MPLLKPVVLHASDGSVIKSSQKLSILVAHYLPHLDVSQFFSVKKPNFYIRNISKAHSADFDVESLRQLVFQHFDND